MSRGRKLLIVGLVFAVGVCLAWPFRKTTANMTLDSVAKTPAIDFRRTQTTDAPRPSGTSPQLEPTAPHVIAKMASIGDADVVGQSDLPRASFDLANHPALSSPLSSSLARRTMSPVTPPVPPQVQRPSTSAYLPGQVKKYHGNARPAYATTDRGRGFDARQQRPAEIRHVVENSDTLEKLAKRYLGDEDRALEIFDLNRDVLDNPHLLPIEAELRIPSDARRTRD